MQAAPCANRSVQLGRIDALLQLVPGALDSGLERFPALLTGRLQLLELPARLLLLLVRLRGGELLLVVHPPLGSGLLGLRLHLLQLRAPLRDLRLHLGDVGVLHLLHPHPANPPLLSWRMRIARDAGEHGYRQLKRAAWRSRKRRVSPSGIAATTPAASPPPARRGTVRPRPADAPSSGPHRESPSPRPAAAVPARSRTTGWSATALRRW